MKFQVDHVENINIEEFMQKYCLPLKSVVISGAIEHWPACQKCDLDYLSNRYHD